MNKIESFEQITLVEIECLQFHFPGCGPCIGCFNYQHHQHSRSKITFVLSSYPVSFTYAQNIEMLGLLLKEFLAMWHFSSPLALSVEILAFSHHHHHHHQTIIKASFCLFNITIIIIIIIIFCFFSSFF